VTAVDDQPGSPDVGGQRRVLGQDLATRDADPVVRRRDVDDVGRVDVDRDVGGPQDLGVGPGLRLLPVLRVAEEELNQVGTALARLGQRVGFFGVRTHVGADQRDGLGHAVEPRGLPPKGDRSVTPRRNRR
jgi:hypothetical protein